MRRVVCVAGSLLSLDLFTQNTPEEKQVYDLAGESVTIRAASEPFGTICPHAVTKRAGVTKRASSASSLTRFVTLLLMHLYDKECRNKFLSNIVNINERPSGHCIMAPANHTHTYRERERGRELIRFSVAPETRSDPPSSEGRS